METKIGYRPYCATFQWPGKEPFMIGTIEIEEEATHYDIEYKVGELFKSLFIRILPDNVSLPKLIKLHPGALFFVDTTFV